MLNVGDVLDNRYEILSRVGHGGMSTVYRAKDLKLGREIAVKMLKEEFNSDEEFIERFKNEARSAAKLSHTNIVATYDIVNHENMHYIVMELVEGITLKDYIAKKGKLSNKETIGIALQTAEGLSAAHKNNIIHRDIKSQNLIISRDGRIKIADFGIARAAAGDTLGKSVIGSAHYIAPEQAKTGEADARSDLYSLGISMYEMITGRLPYQGENTVNVVMAHIQDAMVPPNVYNNEIYPALNDIILKATRKAPEERYQTAEELIEDLKHAVWDPEGHFVKLYDSVGSGQLAAGASATEGKAAASAAKSRPQSVDIDLKGTYDGPEDNIEEEPEVYDDSRSQFLILGITILVLAVAAAIAFFVVRTRNDAVKTAESVTATVRQETTAETTEAAMDYTLSIKGEDLMPDLTGMTVDEARAKLASLQMSMDSSTTDFSDEFKEGTIMNQSPAKNEILNSDSTVYVTVSLGPKAEYVLANLKTMTQDAARAQINDAGIQVSDEITREFSDDVAEDLVIGYKEEGLTDTGERIVSLIVSYGKQEDYVEMPDITGLSGTQLLETLNAAQLSLGSATALNTELREPNIVLTQSVPAGSPAKKGSAVDVQISVGDDGTIPDGTVVNDLLTNLDLEEEVEEETVEELSDDYYYGNIDTSCEVGENNGPGGGEGINVAIRLSQRVNESVEYTVIGEPIPVAPGTRIPVSFRNIRGAYGVEEGTIEVYGVDNGIIYSSFVIPFGPAE